MNVELGLLGCTEDSAAAGWRRVKRGPSRRSLRLRLYLALLSVDTLCLVTGFLIAALTYPRADDDHTIQVAMALIPAYLLSAFGSRAYSVEVIEYVTRGIARAAQSLIVAGGAVLFLAFFFKSSSELSRVIFAIGFSSSFMLLCLGRFFFSQRARALLGGNPYAVALITDDPAHLPHKEFAIVISAEHFEPEAQDPAMYDRLAEVLSDADRVVVSCAPERRLAWVHALKGTNIQAEILAPELAALHPLAIDRLDRSPTIVVARGPLSLPDRLLKRALDIAIASVGLIFVAPVMLLTAIAIKLDSPGPVFFVQIRIGRGNRLFRMLKFRSMRSQAQDGHGHMSTSRDDDRITRVGRVIRALSIDELPQLLNVLGGEMSIVGPRPHALGSRAEKKLFWEIDRSYWHRHAAKPGLTGLAQIRGYRGATELESDLVNRLRADLEYLNGWTIWRDIKIIVLTFRVLVHKNAF